ncbi:MAG: acylphosphatase [Spirochaetaceae bacterium]|jgi:acylphosphatase|nr:acylphosphatase [Spirochaetaceae bacterium]
MAIRNSPGSSAFFALVEGRVQGVGFRYSAYYEARRLGLTGWVKNTHAGEVEIFAEGPKEKLETLLRWLHRGPPGARVDAVRYDLRAPLGVYRDFSIKY